MHPDQLTGKMTTEVFMSLMIRHLSLYALREWAVHFFGTSDSGRVIHVLMLKGLTFHAVDGHVSLSTPLQLTESVSTGPDDFERAVLILALLAQRQELQLAQEDEDRKAVEKALSALKRRYGNTTETAVLERCLAEWHRAS